MEVMIALGTFLTVTLLIYGLGYRRADTGSMDARLGGLRYTRPNRESLHDPEATFGARVWTPLLTGAVRRANSILPSTMAERMEGSITRAGLKMSPGQFIVLVAVTGGVLPLLLLALFAMGGSSGKALIVMYLVLVFMGAYGPRLWLGNRIKRRQKEIWKALPDAFDLITASVEAGLGIDAAFTRVIEKVRGPFADELTRSMREITMGRSRREAFMEMADRTGVDELRSFVNAIVQAESMGISIGSVIRVQTGVIRTKRRQKAEEQAFKAPIKMVFPLVFFIFPAIMIVIGGPAAIQMKDSFGG